jgi:hypothetical protein
VDENLGVIQKLIRDHVFDCVRRGSARDCDALPEPLSSFRALFCWREGGRKTRIMLPTSRRHSTSRTFSAARRRAGRAEFRFQSPSVLDLSDAWLRRRPTRGVTPCERRARRAAPSGGGRLIRCKAQTKGKAPSCSRPA